MKRYTRTDIGIAFAQLCAEARLHGYRATNDWRLTMGSRVQGQSYRLTYRKLHGGLETLPIGRTARDATRFLEAMLEGMRALRKEETNGTD